MKNLQEKLTQVGLTKAQALIYLSLLKLNKATVKEIAEECGFHRTNIYDIIDELKEKGLITYYKEGKSAYYKSVNPEHLSIIINEKKEILQQTLPDLQKIFTDIQEKVDVQIYKGNQGMKSAWNNVVKKENIDLYGLNVGGQLRAELPIFARQIFRQLKEKKINHKGIYTNFFGSEKGKHEIRYIHPKYATPVTTHIYENTVLIQVWNPEMVAIEIKSKRIADAYIDQFKMLWKDASKTPLK